MAITEEVYEKLRLECERLKLELALRVLPATFLVDIPKEHRVHGQHSAFLSGVETAWRGFRRDNPYEFHTAQRRAWDTGFKMGAERFAKAVVEGKL